MWTAQQTSPCELLITVEEIMYYKELNVLTVMY